jgi:hypothetical protein
MLEYVGEEEELKISPARPRTGPFQQVPKLLDVASLVLGFKAPQTSFCGTVGSTEQC